MGIRKWQMPQIDREQVEELKKQTDLSPIVAAILVGRGCTKPEQISDFQTGHISMYDPFLLKDMDIAVRRLTQAVDEGEMVAVYGDYDCDGMTATSILFSYLQDMGARVLYYIPDRDKEGYGLNCKAIDELAENEVTLIVTVDNGISALEEAAYAKTKGIDVIITDHHQPRETLPEALAVIDPHRPDDTYPFKNLCGVGIAFKLICAMEGDLTCEEMLLHYGSLLAIGTIADVVELTGENREFVKVGLESIQNHENLGISALLEVGSLSGRAIDSGCIAFGIAPRLNAAGRVGKAQRTVELLLAEDEEEAAELAEEINEYNDERKQLVSEIVREIGEKITKQPEIVRQRVIVIYGENWHHGVTGIAASKIVERYGKPCILISLEGDEARGSARSVEGYSIIDAISRCSSLLTRFGGHNQAAGLTIPTSDVDAFIKELQEDACKHFDIMPVGTLRIDVPVTIDEVDLPTVEALRKLEPFGSGNETPVAALLNCRLEGVVPISDGKHIRMRLSQNGKVFNAVYFGMTPQAFPYRKGDTVDVAANLEINEYNGERLVSIKAKDIRLSSVKQDKLIVGRQYYEKYLRNEPLEDKIRKYIAPEREDIALIYRYLKREQAFPYGYDVLWCRLRSMNYCKMMICIDIMQELGLIEVSFGEEEPILELPPQAKKVDLQSSMILKRLKAGDD